MNGIGFCNGFYFTEYCYEKFHYTDGRKGAPHHYIAYMEQGNCRIVSDSVTVEASAGEAIYIPMGLSYQSYWYGNPVRLRSYGFQYLPEAEGKSYRLQKLPAEFSKQITQIPLDHRPDAAALGKLYTLMGQLLPHLHIAQFCNTHRVFDEAQKYLYDNPDCHIADVARHCCVSESALYAIFKKAANKTPNDVRQEMLVKKARQLLTTTDRSIQEISDSLNFSSVSYFRKVLKKHTGQTPREIRKSSLSV